MTTTSTIPGFAIDDKDYQSEIERRILARVRHMEATAGRHERPFALTIVVQGNNVLFFDGHPAGKVGK